MTPKEKAQKIFDLYDDISWTEKVTGCGDVELFLPDEIVKKFGLIAINEVIEQWDYVDTYLADLGGELNPNLRYWYEVKKEFKKLINNE